MESAIINKGVNASLCLASVNIFKVLDMGKDTSKQTLHVYSLKLDSQ
jgi:hypothetical protein